MKNLRRVAYLGAIVFSGCSGRGNKKDPVAIPQNVAATAGYQTATVTWDAVADATGYSVYVATTPSAPIESITPVELTTTTHVETALANWQTRYYRVTARIASRESEPSAEVSAMPNGGYLVAHRTDGITDEVAVFQSDDPALPAATPVETIPNARLGKSFGNPRLGVAWRDPGVVKDARIGVFLTRDPIVLGEQAGREYEFIDVIPSATPRLAWVDCELNGAMVQNCGVSTSLLDGTDVRSLHTGCNTVQGSLSKVAAHGIVFSCYEAGPPPEEQWWFSDGVAPAFQLVQTILPVSSDRELVALMPTRAVFRYPAEAHLTTQPLTSGGVEGNLYEAETTEISYNVLVLAGRSSFNDRLIFVRDRALDGAAARYKLYTIDELGANPDLKLQSAGNFTLRDVSPDGTRFTTTSLVDGADFEAWSFGVAANANPDACGITGVISTTDDAFDAKFTTDGDIAAAHVSDGWRVFDDCYYDSGTMTTVPAVAHAGPLQSASFSWAGRKGGFFFLNASAGDFVAVNAGDQMFDISLIAPNPRPVHRAEGVVLFVDSNYDAWSSVFNPTSGFFEKVLIDSIDTTRIDDAGDGPGNRTFLVMTREGGGTPHGDLVVYDIVNRGAPAAPILATSASETGFFVPN